MSRTLQAHAPPPERQRGLPRTQLRKPASLAAWLAGHPCARGQALRAAYTGGGFTMCQIAAHVGLSVSRVSRLIAAAEARGSSRPR